MASSALRLETSEGARLRGAWVVLCPRCSAQLVFQRSGTPEIDSSGFETCRLDCTQCEASLAGVIDPYDDAVLLSVVPG
jgi:hypothetical protein